MNARNAKKLRREARRQVNENFGSGMEALAHLTRERPQWIPKWIWILAYVPLFKRQYLPVVYRNMP